MTNDPAQREETEEAITGLASKSRWHKWPIPRVFYKRRLQSARVRFNGNEAGFVIASAPIKAETGGMKRPLSHVCAVFIYTMFIAINVIRLLHGIRDVASLALAAFCAVQLLGMFVAPRERRQYPTGIVLLTLIAMNTLYDMALSPGYQLYIHAPGAQLTWPKVALNAAASCALFLLAYDYAFGAESRRFFGLPPRK